MRSILQHHFMILINVLLYTLGTHAERLLVPQEGNSLLQVGNQLLLHRGVAEVHVLNVILQQLGALPHRV